MIAVLKHDASPERTEMLIEWLKKQGLGVHVSQGEYTTVLGLIGNTKNVDMDMLRSLDIVESVTRVTDPFKAVNRKFHPDDSIIPIGDAGLTLGGGSFFGKVGSFEDGYEFDAVVLDDSALEHPQELSLRARLERCIYLADERHIAAKFVAGTRLF